MLGLISLGCGLLVEQVAGISLQGALRLPAGLALAVVIGLFTTAASQTAGLTIPLVVAAAVAGLLLSYGGRPKVNPSLVTLGLGTFAVYAAPVVLTGRDTFTGYVKLDDTSSFLGFTDQIMAHGRNLSGIAPSTFQRLVDLNIAEGYPVGTFLPLGIGSKLVGKDPLWIYQPCMAFFAAMTALALYALLDGAVRSTWLRAGIAFVAGQAALLYAYSLWGGIKELAAAAFIGLAAALVPVSREELRRGRDLVPFAVASAACFGVLSVTGIIWIGLLAVPALVLIARSPGRFWRPAAGGVVAVLVLSIPSLLIAHQFIHYATSNLLTQSERLGNLIRPLRFIQIFGIWTGADFRVNPENLTANEILIAVCALSAVWGAVYAFRRSAWRLPLAAIAALAGAAILQLHSSPWLVGKALASGSPFIVLLALAGAAGLMQIGRRTEGIVIAAAIAGGVLFSNVLGYRAVWLAPPSQLAELQQIGTLYRGDGPALMTEYQPYGVRHFLRSLDAEGASELRVRQVPLVDGSELATGKTADLDRFRYPDILVYRTYVLRTSPVESRPSTPYQLVWHGTYYDVWQRPATGGPQVLLHIPLGSDESPSAVPSCSLLEGTATAAARQGALLAVARTPDPLIVPLDSASRPAGWYADVSQPGTVTPTRHGTLTTTVTVPQAGAFTVWLSGFILRDVSIAVDGRHVGSIDQTGNLYNPAGTVALTAGTHTVTLTYGDSWWRPGATAPGYPIGPLVLSPVTPSSPVEYVAPAKAASLCGQSLDWIEVVKPG